MPRTPQSLSPRDRSGSPVAIQPTSFFGSEKEGQAFSYFIGRTSESLAGYYTCDFWNCVLLQAAQYDPGIRHATIALASVHRTFEETGDAETYLDAFGLHQYQLAIRQHIDDLSQCITDPSSFGAGRGREGLGSYLASSMVFICIEMLQGHFLSAVALTKGAVNLFYEHIVPAADPTASPWPIRVFEALLGRLQMQALGLIGLSNVGALTPPTVQTLYEHENPTVPEKFKSLTDARDFYDFSHWAHAFRSKVSGTDALAEDEEGRHIFESHAVILVDWAKAFGALIAELDFEKLSQRERNAITTMQIKRMQTDVAWQILKKDTSKWQNPMLWDEHEDVMASTLDRLESVLISQSRPVPASPVSGGRMAERPRHMFTLDSGIIAPLYTASRLCRDPVIRRRAIYLLRAYPVREGMWDGLLAARAAEIHMEIEEEAAREIHGREIFTSSDVPEEVRIIALLPEFKPGQTRWAKCKLSRGPVSVAFDVEPEWHYEVVVEW